MFLLDSENEYISNPKTTRQTHTGAVQSIIKSVYLICEIRCYEKCAEYKSEDPSSNIHWIGLDASVTLVSCTAPLILSFFFFNVLTPHLHFLSSAGHAHCDTQHIFNR